MNEQRPIETICLDNVVPDVFAGTYGDTAAPASDVWNTRLTLRRGSFYLVSAESGAGKSSLCGFIYGNRRDYSGHIYFDDTDIRSLTPRGWSRLRQRSLSVLPQELRLFPELTALENIEIKNRLTGFRSRDEINRLLEAVGIAGLADRQAGQMSVGQQQRVAIVRALCQPFDFLLLDEPVSHLDSRNNTAVATLLAGEARRLGAAIVATSVGNDIMIDNTTRLRL